MVDYITQSQVLQENMELRWRLELSEKVLRYHDTQINTANHFIFTAVSIFT